MLLAEDLTVCINQGEVKNNLLTTSVLSQQTITRGHLF